MIQYFPIFVLATLIVSTVSSNDFDDLSNLGERISASVYNEVAPLKNLGDRINAAVEEELKPIRGRHSSYSYIRARHGSQMADLGEQISASVQSGLAPLQNLGQKIQENVYQKLEPVRAMQILSGMKSGVGGITIATHSPSGKQFIFKHGNAYQCQGTITATGECDGTLKPYTTKNEEDYCFIRNNFSVVNDYICIGATSIQVVNNNVQCTNLDNSPVLMMKKEQFENMCKSLSQSVEYKYIADPNNPLHVKIPNPNKYVRCSNNEENICVFTEPNNVNGMFISQNFS